MGGQDLVSLALESSKVGEEEEEDWEGLAERDQLTAEQREELLDPPSPTPDMGDDMQVQFVRHFSPLVCLSFDHFAPFCPFLPLFAPCYHLLPLVAPFYPIVPRRLARSSLTRSSAS